MCDSSSWPLPSAELRGAAGIWHLLQPLTHWVRTDSAFPKFDSIWNSLRVSGGYLTWDPNFLRFHLKGNQGAPHISFSHCPLYHNPTTFVPSSVSPSSCVSWPPCSVPAPSPFCALATVSFPACLGFGPAACLAILPGSPSAALRWPHPLLPPQTRPLILL